MTPAEWARCCGTMTRLWPHRPMPPEAATEWYPLLADLDGHAVLTAIQAVALEPGNVYPPSLGQLRGACEPPPRPWEDAWHEALELVARHGFYAPEIPATSDAALADVLAAYGWRETCTLDRHDTTTRAQWRDAYRSAQARQAALARRGVAGRALTTGGRAPQAIAP